MIKLRKVDEVVNTFFFSTFLLNVICYNYIGDMMKRIFKGVFLPVVIAVILGYVLGKFVYNTYNDNLYNTLSSSRLYLVENGEYDTIQAMREENSNNNYVYYKDQDKYKSVVGITKDYDNIEKIKSLYNDNLSVFEYYVEDDALDKRQEEYEKKLMEANNLSEVREAVDDILALYRGDDVIKLVSIG